MTRHSHSLHTTALLLTLSVLFSQVAAAGWAQSPSWTLKVCADQDNLPYSNAKGEGFENLIMATVATAIGADLSYVWLPLQRRTSEDINLLRTGTCDVFLDIGNGAEPFLPTLDYYESTYVFVYRADAPEKPASLDDPALGSLRLGTAAASPAGTALALRGVIDNVTNYFPVPPAGVTEAIVADVAAGKIDAGAAWGPEVSYYAARQATRLEMVPITPEIDVDGLSMIYTAAMGVRSGDTELRDLLNQGMARRWDAIQGILASFGTPTVPLPEPVLSLAMPSVRPTRIGVVVPMLTGDQPIGALTDDMVGSLAALGATMAAEDLEGVFEPSGRRLDVLITSAPDSATALRAADRLLGQEGVSALIGGFGTATATALSDLASEHGVVFMNVDAQDETLRGATCSRNTFHVAASSSMYVDALVSAFAALGANDWFFVTNGSQEEAQRLERASADIARLGGTVASLTVGADAVNFAPALDVIRRADPDVVVMLLDARSQLIMLGQYETTGLPAKVVGYPEPATQLREYYAVALYEDPSAGSEPHLAQWDASLDGGNAGELNVRFNNRFGKGMDPPAWATYVAVKLLADAALTTGTDRAADWVAYLEDPASTMDVFKGAGTTFRSWDHQLRQPLYLVGINPNYLDTKAFRDIAYLLTELPSEGGVGDRATALDMLGTERAASPCVPGD